MRSIVVASYLLAAVIAHSNSGLLHADGTNEASRPVADIEANNIEKQFSLPPGFHVQLVAREPDIVNPMSMCVDENGAIYVTEAHTYRWGPEGSPFTVPTNPIKRFDLDKHGRVTNTATVAEGFANPVIGVAVYRQQLFATCLNELISWDIGRDGKLSNRKVLVKDAAEPWNPFGMYRVHVALDGKLWLAMADHPSSLPVTLTGSDGRQIQLHGRTGGLLRCNLDGSNLELLVQGFRAPYAFDVDPWGHLWAISNGQGSPNLYVHVIFGLDYGYASRNVSYAWLAGQELLSPPTRDMGEGANTSALHYYSSMFPKDYWGDIFVSNWGNHGANPPNRTITRFERSNRKDDFARRVASEQLATESLGTADTALTDAGVFLASSDPMFRPTAAVMAPDGGLYVLDWHGRDDENDRSGRILKINYSAKTQTPSPTSRATQNLVSLKTSSLVKLLGDRNQFVRERAQKALIERGDRAAKDLQRAAAKSDPFTAAFAIWTLTRINTEKATFAVAAGLQHSDARVRAHALRQLRQLAGQSLGGNSWCVTAQRSNATKPASISAQTLAELTAPLLLDGDPEVRVEAALAQHSATTATRGLLQALEITTERRVVHQIGMELARRADADSIVALAASTNQHWNHAALIAIDVARSEQTALSSEIQRTHFEMLEEIPPAELAAKLKWLRERKPVLLEVEFDRINRGEVQLLDHEKLAALAFLETTRVKNAPTQFLLATLAHPNMQQQALRAVRRQATGNAQFREPTLNIVRTSKSVETQEEAIFTLALLDGGSAQDWSACAMHPTPAIATAALRSLRQQGLRSELQAELIRTAPQLAARSDDMADELALTLRVSGVNDEQCGGLSLVAKQRDRAELARSVLARLPKASVALGRLAFHSPLTACDKCHAVRTDQESLGPNLASIGSAAQPEYLLESILAPSQVLKTGYESEAIETSDGETHTGLIAVRDQALIVKTATAEETSIPLDHVRRRTPSRTSLMPEGLDAVMTEAELADLVAYLLSLKQ